jgi:hypothetical protein
VAKEGRKGTLKYKFGIAIEIEAVDPFAANTKRKANISNNFQCNSLSYKIHINGLPNS